MIETIETVEPVTVMEVAEAPPVKVNLKTLLEAGSHFGSTTSSWHPRMSPFIYGSRNGIYIIDLQKTVRIWDEHIRPLVVSAAEMGKSFMFVGTKRQGKDALIAQAKRSGSAYVTERWRAGLLTNFKVVSKQLESLEKLEKIIAKYEAGSRVYTKSEVSKYRKQVAKLERDFGGLKDLKKLPDFIFITDASKEYLAIQEAKVLGIPVIALCDTNVDPSKLDYPIPSNDDAVKTITLFVTAIAEAIQEGRVSFMESIDLAKVEELESQLDASINEAKAEKLVNKVEETFTNNSQRVIVERVKRR
jgi:small subunit ribosomal protein S2